MHILIKISIKLEYISLRRQALETKKDPSNEGSKSGGPGSNRQPLAWKAKALPLSYRRNKPNYTKIGHFLKGFAERYLIFT